jgi:hypothetical protein
MDGWMRGKDGANATTDPTRERRTANHTERGVVENSDS